MGPARPTAAIDGLKRRLSLAAIIAVTSPLMMLVFAPAGRLACDSPYLTETSPDGRWTITVCGRPVWFAIPGSGSDAPGWIVLRDETSSIRGVSSLSMLQLYGGVSGSETEWTSSHVRRLMVFDMQLSQAQDPLDRWRNEHIWRLRALVGLVPDNEDQI